MKTRVINNNVEIKIYPSTSEKYFYYSCSIFIVFVAIYFGFQKENRNIIYTVLIIVFCLVLAYFISKKYFNLKPEFILTKDVFWCKDTLEIKIHEIKFLMLRSHIDFNVLYIYDNQFQNKKSFSSSVNQVYRIIKDKYPNKTIADENYEDFEYWINLFDRKIINSETLEEKFSLYKVQ